MKQCPQCNFENIRNSFYCERCGTLLPSNATAQPTKTTHVHHAQDYTVPMLEMYTPTPPPPPPPVTVSYSVVYPSPKIEPTPARARSIIYITGRVMLYLIGTLSASFGLFGFLTAFMNDSAAIVGFLFLFMSSIIVMVMVLIVHRSPYLLWWQRLLGLFAATGGIFVILLIGAAIVSTQSTNNASKISDIVYGSIVMLYGVVAAAIALW